MAIYTQRQGLDINSTKFQMIAKLSSSCQSNFVKLDLFSLIITVEPSSQPSNHLGVLLPLNEGSRNLA